MTETVEVSAKEAYKPKGISPFADYDAWFAKPKWSLIEVCALLIGLIAL